MLIDWQPLLEKIDGKVNFSTFYDTFESCFCDVVLASLGLPEHKYISVDWKVKEKCFMIDLFVDPLTIESLDFIFRREICCEFTHDPKGSGLPFQPIAHL